jgi:hypothetical protein
MMVKWKKGLHSFVKKGQAIKYGSLSQIGNSTIDYLHLINDHELSLEGLFILLHDGTIKKWTVFICKEMKSNNVR